MSIPMSKVFNALQQIDRRSDRVEDAKHLMKAFTDAGHMLAKLSNKDNQIIYGRRGTGKTHALLYLMKNTTNKDHIYIYIDMRKIGSDGAIILNENLELKDKSTRLLIETLKFIHEEIRQFCLKDTEKYNFHLVAPLLDDLLMAITKTRIIGERNVSSSFAVKNTDKSEVKLAFFQPELTGLFNSGSEVDDKLDQSMKGQEKPDLSTRNICRILEELITAIGVDRLWILFDEWSSVPNSIQPFISEMLKKFIIPISKITIKIAAIEQRSQFRGLVQKNEIGLELGADIMADIVLDDFLVFDNKHERAVEFYKSLFHNHLKAIMTGVDEIYVPFTRDEFVGLCFQSIDVFKELVRSSEGVPRDAINILGNAIQYAGDNKITSKNIREAAKRWYETDKLNSISSNESAGKLLNWLMDEVLGTRRTRAFLLESSMRDKNIDFLFDHRILHIQKRSISAKNSPGKRYTAYAIDYGCYIDMTGTSKKPLGFLLEDSRANPEEAEYLPDVPKDDMRSTRRSILDLDIFYTQAG